MGTVFEFKTIKPKKLNIDAIRLELLNELRKEGTVQKKELKKTVSTWKSKPGFESLISLSGGDASILTGPVGDTEAVQHWVWTDEGTKPHRITARRAPFLRFRYPYFRI